MKRSPAPWSGSDVRSAARRRGRIFDAEGNPVADVLGVSNGGRGNYSAPHYRPNRDLIAAAPALLEALKLVLSWDEVLEDKVMRRPKRDTLAWKIKVAIQKADPGFFPGFDPEK